MGIRAFVSYGNRCDVTEAELLEHFANDDKTNVILMYVEGLADGRNFLVKAKETTRKKPIIALKSGKTDAGRPCGCLAHSCISRVRPNLRRSLQDKQGSSEQRTSKSSSTSGGACPPAARSNK